MKKTPYKIQKLVGSQWVTLTTFSPDERTAIQSTQASKKHEKDFCIRLIDCNGCPVLILNWDCYEQEKQISSSIRPGVLSNFQAQSRSTST